MANIDTSRARFFFEGMLSVFRLRPRREFLDWYESYSRETDAERLLADMARVEMDMRTVINRNGHHAVRL